MGCSGYDGLQSACEDPSNGIPHGFVLILILKLF
jgi:hypothetical protein